MSDLCQLCYRKLNLWNGKERLYRFTDESTGIQKKCDMYVCSSCKSKQDRLDFFAAYGDAVISIENVTNTIKEFISINSISLTDSWISLYANLLYEVLTDLCKNGNIVDDGTNMRRRLETTWDLHGEFILPRCKDFLRRLKQSDDSEASIFLHKLLIYVLNKRDYKDLADYVTRRYAQMGLWK